MNSGISVIIPTYNYGHYLIEAIDSALNQSYKPYEIIIADDGSTDNTVEVIKRYGSTIKYFYRENGGIGAARNLGIQHATGDFLAFLDSDDIWLPKKLELQLKRFQQDTELDMVFGHVKQFFSADISASAKQKIQLSEEQIAGYIASTLLIRSSSFHRVGLFEPQWTVGEFIDWYSKAQEKKLKGILLDDLVTLRRIHDGHQHTRTQRNFQHYVHVIKATLQRRKEAK